MTNPIVQYIVVRTDLITSLGWTVGAVIAQACHATTAAALQYKDDEHTKQYFADVNNMHKVVLGISSETKLRNLSKRLSDFYVEHRVWTEQPENTPTCLVTKPAPKSDKAEYFRKLQLFRIPSDKSKKRDKGLKTEDDEFGSEQLRGHGVGNQVHLSRDIPNINDSSFPQRGNVTGGQMYRGSEDRHKLLNDERSRVDHSPEKRSGSGNSSSSRGDGKPKKHMRSSSEERKGKRNQDDDPSAERRGGSGGRERGENEGEEKYNQYAKYERRHDEKNDRDNEGKEKHGGYAKYEQGERRYDEKNDRNNEGKEKHGGYAKYEPGERRHDREKNDRHSMKDDMDRLSDSPKLPPISPKPL